MDEVDFGDLCFSLIVSYIGALEFLIILRHLVHWSGRHNSDSENNEEYLEKLKDKLRQQLEKATAREEQAKTNLMQDGVTYKDGYRFDPHQIEIDDLKSEIFNIEERIKRRAELEAELARQRRMRDETKRQLERAEGELEEKRKQQQKKEDAESQWKILAAEKQVEAEQMLRETKESENQGKMFTAEKQKEAEQKQKEDEEAEKHLQMSAEEQKEAKQTQKCEEAVEEQRPKEYIEGEERRNDMSNNESDEMCKLLRNEREYEANQAEMKESENQSRKESKNQNSSISRLLIESERLRQSYKNEEEEEKTESENEEKVEFLRPQRKKDRQQKLIEDNARRFLEAEQEMVQKMIESAKQMAEEPRFTPVIEEPIVAVSKNANTSGARSSTKNSSAQAITATVKTQFGQGSNESFTLSTKPLFFPDVSDDATSNEPYSSKQSSFSTQPSEEIMTGNEDFGRGIRIPTSTLGLQGRQEPDGGEDNTTTVHLQYDEEYLRSLDGIKHSSLMREDGSGRRRAFKKRRSSGSSNSSRDSRTSREEELRMFTSLEEEELGSKLSGEADFTPIKYTSEKNLKVKSHHHRRHKRSPAKDSRSGEDNLRKNLEMLGEESTNPWGEVVPEHYKNTEFWRREKAMSIDEEEIELELPTTREEAGNENESANNKANSSSLEEATHVQNEQAMTAMSSYLNKATEGSKEPSTTTHNEEEQAHGVDSSAKLAGGSDRSNLQISSRSESQRSSPSPSSASPRLRRSPRIEEIDHYEERWQETETSRSPAEAKTPLTPEINIQPPSDNSSWRDDFGLIMPGLSDFYDFQASVNPSRSHESSRNASPVQSQPSSPLPKDAALKFDRPMTETVFDIYDNTADGLNLRIIESQNLKVDEYNDTGNCQKIVAEQKNIDKLIGTLHDIESSNQSKNQINHLGACDEKIVTNPGNIAEKCKEKQVPEIYIEQDPTESQINESSNEDMCAFVRSLRNERLQYSRSRSPSPLPTSGNLERSLEARRAKLIKHNEDLFEKLVKPTPEETERDVITENALSSDGQNNEEELNKSVPFLHVAPIRSRSTSPLPLIGNCNKNLDTRCIEDRSDRLAVSSQQDVNSTNSSLDPKPSLKHERRARSRSPLPTMDNIERSLETRRCRLIQHNDEVAENLKLKDKAPANDENQVRHDNEGDEFPNRSKSVTLLASVENFENSMENQSGNSEKLSNLQTKEDGERQEMKDLVESLRLAQKRVRSRSPFPTMENQLDGIEKHSQKLIQQNDNVFEHLNQTIGSPVIITIEAVEEDSTRKSLRSHSPTVFDDKDIQQHLSLDSNREQKTILAEKSLTLDNKTLFKFNTANKEAKPRIFSHQRDFGGKEEANDQISEMPAKEFLRKLRCTPTTPDYERSQSDELKDVQRIKHEMIAGGFKRSTYVNESLDLGSEYENLRRKTALFQRSKSPSPSFSEETTAILDAAQKRRIQDNILSELISSSYQVTEKTTPYQDENRNGAKPKLSSINNLSEMSADLMEDMRRENVRFQRSRSCSRSPPLAEQAVREIAAIEAEAAKREMQDRILDSLSNSETLSFQNFQDFSRHLNADFLEDRRASDSAMIGQFHDSGGEGIGHLDFEPEEYHHYRRFSLNQAQPVEEYPDDNGLNDYMYVSEIEIQTQTGTRTLLTEDIYGAGGIDANLQMLEEDIIRHDQEEEETDDGSEDERQTVVEVDDDEIDTDICDFNERGPTDESHHEQSECEEAERAMDHYATCDAADWRETSEVNDICKSKNEMYSNGAIGGTGFTDADSYTIEQIYDDAIKNRKQSGILREFDSILHEMQKSYEHNNQRRKGSKDDEQERYDICSKARASEKGEAGGDGAYKKSLTLNFIEAEKRDTEMRYLGDANLAARQSTRLRSRYGYIPKLQSSATTEDLNVDLNYKPKREYNWRKNFKLDESFPKVQNEASEEINLAGNCKYNSDEFYGPVEKEDFDGFSDRKFSLGGESITLYSRSPDKELTYAELAVKEQRNYTNENTTVLSDNKGNNESSKMLKKIKKKKSKKKTAKDQQFDRQFSKDEDSDVQNCSRRSSNEMDSSPIEGSLKRKSRSRRSSRSSLTASDDNFNSIFTSRNRAGLANDATMDGSGQKESSHELNKKKIKKRKKVKEKFLHSHDIKEEMEQSESVSALTLPTVSASLTPESASLNMLAALSPQQSVCVTPASTESEKSLKVSILKRENSSKTPIIPAVNSTIATERKTLSSSAPETFDILKDANFYPLF